MSTPGAIELHFRDGFRGEAVEVQVNGATVASFAARTRPQIGLAHVETIQVGERDEVVIQVGGVRKQVPVVKGVTQYAIERRDNELTVEPAKDRLVYM